MYRDRLNRLDEIVTDTSVDENRQLIVHTLIDEKHTMSKDIEFIAESKTMHACFNSVIHLCSLHFTQKVMVLSCLQN